jgi:NhaP-type Na+/H+ or K+/H+ antiporter
MQTTLIRMLPVAILVLGTRLLAVSVLFAGWFGPRGCASLVVAWWLSKKHPCLSGAMK